MWAFEYWYPGKSSDEPLQHPFQQIKFKTMSYEGPIYPDLRGKVALITGIGQLGPADNEIWGNGAAIVSGVSIRTTVPSLEESLTLVGSVFLSSIAA